MQCRWNVAMFIHSAGHDLMVYSLVQRLNVELPQSYIVITMKNLAISKIVWLAWSNDLSNTSLLLIINLYLSRKIHVLHVTDHSFFYCYSFSKCPAVKIEVKEIMQEGSRGHVRKKSVCLCTSKMSWKVDRLQTMNSALLYNKNTLCSREESGQLSKIL